jgi:prepilin-type N-terminal cleavage/methylation domain-containing protein
MRSSSSAPRRVRGFTLVELLVVIAIIGLLAGLLLPVLSSAREAAIDRAAQNQLRAISMALEGYKQEFRRYPPDNYPFKTTDTSNDETHLGSILLAYYLTQQFTVGERQVGPFLQQHEGRFVNIDGQRALGSPLGGFYAYRRIYETSTETMSPRPEDFIVVDPGRDKLIGDGFKSNTGRDDPTARDYEKYCVFDLDPAKPNTMDNYLSRQK